MAELDIDKLEMDDKKLLAYYKSQVMFLETQNAIKDSLLKKAKDDISDLKKLVKYYKEIATVDSLTGLKNRRAIENFNDYDSVIMGDVDLFKKINDNYGHDTGDKVLKLISSVLKKLVRDGDLVLRWGGEEFIILLKNCSLVNAFNKASELRVAVSALSKELGFNISMSFGVSEISKNSDVETVVKEVDQAMYESKSSGRNKVTVYQKKRKVGVQES